MKKILSADLDDVLMKVRQNYLCPRRLERALQQANELFTGPEQNELKRLAEWARTTRDGSLSDLSVEPDPKVWIQVCSEAHICTQKTCGQDSRCFYQQARKRLLAADILVINHTLLFILLGDPELQARIAEVSKRTDDEFLKAELQEYARRIRDVRAGIAAFLQQGAHEHVYWVERTGKTAQFLTLNAAPIDIAPVLRQMIFRDNCSCIMTSATLSVGRSDLAYFRRRIGADEVEPALLGSPFSFQKQMRMFIVKKMPDPRDAKYEEALEHWIAHFVEKTDGRAFVLFTNHRSMQQVGERMAQFFSQKQFNLLVQGGGAPRGKLLDQFKTTPGSVLFGTDSFWMGVDVPGEALSNVIITRLPFAVPDHPLIEAKLELIEERGGDPFTEYSLPEAILKLRQGVGRLIRTKSDHGIIVILDSRVLTRPYGRAFMQALPKCPVEVI